MYFYTCGIKIKSIFIFKFNIFYLYKLPQNYFLLLLFKALYNKFKKEKTNKKKEEWNMDLTTKDIIKKKILDAQENVRDYQMYSHKIDDKAVADLFGEFAENEAIQAKNFVMY